MYNIKLQWCNGNKVEKMKQDKELQEAVERNLSELVQNIITLTKVQAAVLHAGKTATWSDVGSLATINQAIQDVRSHIRGLGVEWNA